jgi:hypothetical protein
MTCRNGRHADQPPYDIADVMAFVVTAPPDRQQPVAQALDDVPGDGPAAVSALAAGAYRFAWSG